MADEQYFTKMVDGQLSVATVAQSGEIIPEESRPGEKYTTALVQTDDGPQLCVKTYDLNGGGGGTVDQTYDPTSTNAQSGTAVAEAVAPALKNTATGANSLAILGTSTGQNSVAIGKDSSANYLSSTALGNAANAYATGTVAIGYFATASKNYSIAIGDQSSAQQNYSIAIGGLARSAANSAIQIGKGDNSTANSFQVFNYQMLDGTTGKIPMGRLPIVQCTQAEYDALVSGGTVDSNTIYCIVPA